MIQGYTIWGLDRDNLTGPCHNMVMIQCCTHLGVLEQNNTTGPSHNMIMIQGYTFRGIGKRLYNRSLPQYDFDTGLHTQGDWKPIIHQVPPTI